MRRTVVTPWTRELAGLCAHDAQKRAAPATATASRSALASRTLSRGAASSAPLLRARTSPSQLQQQQTRAPCVQTPEGRRWLSGSPAPRSSSQGASATSSAEKDGEKKGGGGGGGGGEEQSSTKTDQHKPLPYYALFPQTLPAGAPPDGPFHIDVRALRREFLQLQAASHPDYHHAASQTTEAEQKGTAAETRRRAEALSSHINSAYRTLSSPLLRAQYVLAERFGLDLAGDEASRLSGPADPQLLTEVLLAREAVEEAESEEDLEEPSAENDARLAAAEDALGRALEAGDVDAAIRETVRLKYWENIRESIREWEGGKPVVLQH